MTPSISFIDAHLDQWESRLFNVSAASPPRQHPGKTGLRLSREGSVRRRLARTMCDRNCRAWFAVRHTWW